VHELKMHTSVHELKQMHTSVNLNAYLCA